MGKTYARIINDTVIDCVEADPKDLFHPSVAKDFVEVPAGTEVGATWDGHQWVNPAPPEPEPLPPALIPLIGPIAFQMLFKIEELVAIDAIKETDPVVKIFWKLLDDPRTDYVDRNLDTVKGGVQYLESKGLLAPGRGQEIITGEVTK